MSVPRYSIRWASKLTSHQIAWRSPDGSPDYQHGLGAMLSKELIKETGWEMRRGFYQPLAWNGRGQ